MATILTRVGIGIIAICLAALVLNLLILFAPTASLVRRLDALPHVRDGLLLGTGRANAAGGVWPVYTARIEGAAALVHAGRVDRLIISGYRDGAGRPQDRYDEIADMREDLEALGVTPDRMVDDLGSFRTRDSIEHVGCIAGPGPVIMISQAGHLARALSLGLVIGRHDLGFVVEDPSALAKLLVWTEFLSRFKAIGDIAQMVWSRGRASADCLR